VVVAMTIVAKGNLTVSQDLTKRKWSKSVSWLQWIYHLFIRAVQSDLKYYINAMNSVWIGSCHKRTEQKSCRQNSS
jgi:hypothetical protein